MNGVIVVDKEKGKTSFDEIRKIRKEFNIKKVGHIGTLDPMATGVLPILVGEATKLSDYLMEHDKEYVATLTLGEKRDTGDSEGIVVETKEIPNVNEIELKNVLKSFKGEISQIPPIYSAKCIADNLSRTIMTLLGAGLLSIYNINYAMIIMGIAILFIALILTIYSRDKLGLKPDEYSQKDIYKR